MRAAYIGRLTGSGTVRRVAALALVSALALAPYMASAATDAEFTNHLTGADSVNGNTLEGTTTFNFTVTNVGTVTNDFDLDLNTGGNTISGNTTVGDVSTGDIDAELEVENVVNTAPVVVPMGMGGGDVTVRSENHLTGAGSTNTNTTTTSSTANMTTTNVGTVTNAMTLALNTGNNTIENNTTVGDISTGDIRVRGRVENRVNAEPEANGQGGGTIPPTVIPQPTYTNTPPAVVANLPAATVSGGGTIAKVAQTVTTPKNEFFPAGAALNAAEILSLLALAFLAVYGFDLIQYAYRRRALVAHQVGALRFL